MAFKLKAPVPTERDECEWLMQWAAVKRHEGTRLSDLLIMIPNGTKLAGDARARAIQMNRMKDIGFKPGVFDYLLPVMVGASPGLWLEMKRIKGGIVSPEQRKFDELMHALGWQTAICSGFEEARRVIVRYLKP